MTNIKKSMKYHTQTQFYFLIAENATRPKEPSKIIYMDEVLKFCYHVQYSDGVFEDVPIAIEGQKIINEIQVNYYCSDCRKNTQANLYYDYYMVKDPLWKEFGAGKGCLCITCFQCRMDRELVPEDFTEHYSFNKSNRFIKNLIAKSK